MAAPRGFGFTPARLAAALALVKDGVIDGVHADATFVEALGIGTEQAEGLRAWMRLAGLTAVRGNSLGLSKFGRLVHCTDGGLADAGSWWAFHWRLSLGYQVWRVLSRLEYRAYTVSEIDQQIGRLSPGSSVRTVSSARRALVNALSKTPFSYVLRLVRVESDGRRITGLTKLPVRYGHAPMPAVAYALLDWARREDLSSAPLESLAAPGGPGPILHMSEGALERYVMDIDGAFRGRVLSYSRTAGLNEIYFKREVTPLQVLASHYLRERDDLQWAKALDRAVEEVIDDGAD